MHRETEAQKRQGLSQRLTLVSGSPGNLLGCGQASSSPGTHVEAAAQAKVIDGCDLEPPS